VCTFAFKSFVRRAQHPTTELTHDRCDISSRDAPSARPIVAEETTTERPKSRFNRPFQKPKIQKVETLKRDSEQR